MCNQLLFPKELHFFGANITARIRPLLEEAVDNYNDPERAQALLWRAHELAPEQLEVYVALYKFYFYCKQLDEAERVARMALEAAASQGGFPEDWRALTPASAAWSKPGGAERIYLFTLKALGFIRLRQMDLAGGKAILDKLLTLDPRDQVGGRVIWELAAGLEDIVDAACPDIPASRHPGEDRRPERMGEGGGDGASARNLRPPVG